MPAHHDLTLPVWGPYNKKFVGFSHLADEKKGLRFDIDVFPGFYRRSVMQTKAIADGGAKLWQARADLEHFVIRYELSGDVYCDMHVAQQDETACVRCVFVNDSDRPESLHMNLCASIRLPTFMTRPIFASDVRLAPGGRWINAQDYSAISGAPAIAQDGFRRCEQIAENAVEGFAVHTGDSYLPGSGMRPNGRLRYAAENAHTLTLRYAARQDAPIRINGQRVTLRAGEGWLLERVELDRAADEVIIEPLGAAFTLDGFAVDTEIDASCFVPRPRVYVPEITRSGRSAAVHYPQLGRTYTFTWDTDDFALRELHGAHDDAILSDFIHNHVSSALSGEGEGFYVDLFLRPIFLDPHTRQERIVTCCAGGRMPEVIEEKPLFDFAPNASGEPYHFSQRLLTASTQMNVVWPQYFRGGYIKHNTPGKVWDSYYTWDSGMIALGLVSVDEGRAMECLKTYCMPEGDPNSPYLQHGTPLLTQIFAFKELLDLGRDDLCRTLYPGLRQGYRYLAALPHSDTLCTGLVRTWQLFYNSGGWDDYPPQRSMHMRSLTQSAAPVISTSFLILVAKVLTIAAGALGYEADAPEYAADIRRLSDALQCAWDEETGYFGYTLYDADGNLCGLLRDENGVQLNMGLDGVYPFIAGEGTAHQRERMLRNIVEGMLTPYGVSVVDVRAPYFSHSGYWNGSVWMPHQWILWKALLTAGECELANRIARTALDLWKAESDATHNCYEHFMLATGRGAGFHHFSGLSSPVLNWFCAYHVPGHIEVGYTTRIVSQQWNESHTGAMIAFDGPASAAIITLADGHAYTFTCVHPDFHAEQLYDGTYALHLPEGAVTVDIRAQ